jgi:hypothetical protein
MASHKKTGAGRQQLDVHWRSPLCSPRLAKIRIAGDHKREVADRPKSRENRWKKPASEAASAPSRATGWGSPADPLRLLPAKGDGSC